MKYLEVTLSCTDSAQAEIITAMLSDWPFDSFTEEEGTLRAYIPLEEYTACRDEVERYLHAQGSPFTYREIEQQNWNALWESNFEPIPVEGRCLIRAPFHAHDPQFTYSLEIMPKQSFGTGHHATTYLMVSELLDGSWEGLSGLDMGSGTGVLAILAAKMGAAHVDAVDIDAWAYENALENIAANGVTNRVTPFLGDASLLVDHTYDFVLANINRNILLADMKSYVQTLSPQGTLIVSGILERDIAAITALAESLGLEEKHRRLREGWAALRFQRT